MKLLVLVATITLFAMGCGQQANPSRETVAPMATAQGTIPKIAESGPTDVFGLKLLLTPSKWKVVEATRYHFVAEYIAAGNCQGMCPQLLISTSETDPAKQNVGDEYYRLNVQNEGFVTSTDCQVGASAFDTARQQPGTRIGGRAAYYYINSTCPIFQQGVKGPHQPRRFNWHVPIKRYLIQFVETPIGPTFEEVLVQDMLASAEWR